MPELQSNYMRAEIVTDGEVWLIRNNKQGSVLGFIEWSRGWRCFVFQPQDECIFDANCLGALSQFMAAANAEKARRK